MPCPRNRACAKRESVSATAVIPLSARPQRRREHVACGIARFLLALALATTATFAASAELLAARIRADPIACAALGAQRPRDCAILLLRELRTRAEREYIQSHGLQATSAEIATVRAYERAFAQHDREQRARKLDELDARLVHMDAEMGAAERERLMEFRAVLARLAAYEADVGRGLESPPQVPDATIAHWIEQAKLDPALHRRYGGVVALRPSGPYAHGARNALLNEYMRSAAVEIPDSEIEQQLRAELRRSPALVHAGAPPDFTPFWLRPLVPSYVVP
jgi:hypothetical protein